MRTRIKICGLTREADLAAAVEAGADAIGLVFYPGSKRCLAPRRAAQLRREIPAFVDAVALFVDAAPAEVRAVIDAAGPDLLQWHGNETPEFCRGFGRRYLRAFRVGGPGLDTPAALAGACAAYGDAAGWLFDSYSSGFGGSGLAFDHHLLDQVRAGPAARPLVLSGGLKPETVTAAVRALRPWAVDVSSGVELEPGVKSAERIRAFVAAVRQADAT
jgi:phosphoribosylanthranilate isomerase